LSGSAIRTRVSSIRGMSRSRSSGSGISGARRRIGNADREVCVNEYAVDWSTKRGRQMGREVNHAFRVSVEPKPRTWKETAQVPEHSR
jgi:hypothetical protein